MGTVAAALRKYTALRDTLPAIIRETIDEQKEEILEINKQQLKEGETSTGTKFRKYKKVSYAKEKYALNSLPGLGNPDLMVKQDFVKGMRLEVIGDKIHSFSTDYKAVYLEKNFIADLIYGLTDENRKAFITNTLRPAFIQKIKQFLNK